MCVNSKSLNFYFGLKSEKYFRVFLRFHSSTYNYCFASDILQKKKKVSVFALFNRFVPANEGHRHVPQVQVVFIIFIKFA